MMDSARARTVGSSSTTRTVVGLAFSDFIRPTPLALKTATMGQKRSSNPRSYFTISISPVALMQQKLRRESSDRLQIGRYLDWASRAPQPLPNNFVHAEWITLHDNPNFPGFVDFLRTELDRVGPAHADLCRDFFSRAVALELSFFEAAYTT